MRGVPDFIGCGGLQRTERALRAFPPETDPSRSVRHCFPISSVTRPGNAARKPSSVPLPNEGAPATAKIAQEANSWRVRLQNLFPNHGRVASTGNYERSHRRFIRKKACKTPAPEEFCSADRGDLNPQTIRRICKLLIMHSAKPAGKTKKESLGHNLGTGKDHFLRTPGTSRPVPRRVADPRCF